MATQPPDSPPKTIDKGGGRIPTVGTQAQAQAPPRSSPGTTTVKTRAPPSRLQCGLQGNSGKVSGKAREQFFASRIPSCNRGACAIPIQGPIPRDARKLPALSRLSVVQSCWPSRLSPHTRTETGNFICAHRIRSACPVNPLPYGPLVTRNPRPRLRIGPLSQSISNGLYPPDREMGLA